MGMTHTSLAVQAFKARHGRAPMRSTNHRASDEAWIQNWKVEHVHRLCREMPGYDHYYALRATRSEKRIRKLRLKAASRKAESTRS